MGFCWVLYSYCSSSFFKKWS